MTEFGGVIAKVDALRRDLDGRGLRSIVSAVANDGKGDVREITTLDLGPDRRMSNWGRFRFDAGYDVTSDHTAEIKPRPAAPWEVLDRGRKGGHKVPKGRRRLKRYRTPQGIRSASRDQPWTGSKSRGLRTWTKAQVTISRRTPQRVHEHTVKIIGRHFGRR